MGTPKTNGYPPELTVVMWVLILTGLVVIVWFQKTEIESLFFNYEQPAQNTTAPNLSGDILMSYANTGAPTSYLYLFDVASKTLQTSSVQGFAPSESPDDQYIVATSILPSTQEQPQGVYVYNLQSATTSLFVKSVAQNSTMPQLSPDDTMVVFVEPSVSVPSTTFYSPSSWNIYLSKEGGPANLIAHGVYPHWSPDGSSIVYLGEDGLHQYTLGTSKDALVYPMNNGDASNLQVFTLSKDGTEIAWTDPNQGQLYIGNVTSWTPFTFTFSYDIGTYAYWPVFSPDDTKLAFEQFDSSTSTNAWLTVFNLQTLATENLLDLSQVNQQTLMITDWVNNL